MRLRRDQAVLQAWILRRTWGSDTHRTSHAERTERAPGGRPLSCRDPGVKGAGSQARVASELRPGGTVCSFSVTTISRPVGVGQRPPRVGPGHRSVPAQRGRAVASAASHCRTRTPKLRPGHGGRAKAAALPVTSGGGLRPRGLTSGRATGGGGEAGSRWRGAAPLMKRPQTHKRGLGKGR